MSKTHEVEFYVQVQRQGGKYGRYRNGKHITAAAVKITQEKPSTVGADTVTVKLKIQLPDEAFEPLVPSAVVTVPASMIGNRQAVHVITEDAS